MALESVVASQIDRQNFCEIIEFEIRPNFVETIIDHSTYKEAKYVFGADFLLSLYLSISHYFFVNIGIYLLVPATAGISCRHALYTFWAALI